MGSGLQNFDYSLLLLYIPNFYLCFIIPKKKGTGYFFFKQKKGDSLHSQTEFWRPDPKNKSFKSLIPSTVPFFPEKKIAPEIFFDYYV
jgi:hypothetical protein